MVGECCTHAYNYHLSVAPGGTGKQEYSVRIMWLLFFVLACGACSWLHRAVYAALPSVPNTTASRPSLTCGGGHVGCSWQLVDRPRHAMCSPLYTRMVLDVLFQFVITCCAPLGSTHSIITSPATACRPVGIAQVGMRRMQNTCAISGVLLCLECAWNVLELFLFVVSWPTSSSC